MASEVYAATYGALRLADDHPRGMTRLRAREDGGVEPPAIGHCCGEGTIERILDLAHRPHHEPRGCGLDGSAWRADEPLEARAGARVVRDPAGGAGAQGPRGGRHMVSGARGRRRDDRRAIVMRLRS